MWGIFHAVYFGRVGSLELFGDWTSYVIVTGFVCALFSLLATDLYKSSGLCIDALVVGVCGVGVLLIAFIRNFEWILPQQLRQIVLRYL